MIKFVFLDSKGEDQINGIMEMIKEKESLDTSVKELTDKINELILFNDDVNDFDFVTESIIEVCDLEPIQAEQITLVAHENGKCGIIEGSFNELKPMYESLTSKGITVSIE